ncbi:unnamed protein product [Caenorhabditis angaria]|uniref:Serpentine receptor class gamma n=1 Tax=Caenorhabditis angaria TaxID=860376 RepID=A0A9P1IFP4_9PELO|nr:unnamed protein product [Caenorhabditis angaria]
MSNITSDGSIEIQCNLSYDNTWEIIKYVIQFVYLIFGSVLHLLILRTVFWKEKTYRSNSFFMIYALDSLGSLLMLCFAASLTRPFLFIPPLCPILSPIFFEPSIFLQALYIFPNYLRAIKSVTQILMSINRMTCVISPMNYITIWKKYLKFAIIITLLSPFLVIWNLFLSRVYISPSRGGFSPNYLKYVEWASLSLFHLVFISLAIIITIISTVITLTYLLMLPMRLKSAERTLCFANITISIDFMIIASFQTVFAFFPIFDSSTLYTLHFYSYDFLNLSAPIVLILINPQLRDHIFKGGSSAIKVTATQNTALFNSVSMSNITLDGRIEIECDLSYDNSSEIIKCLFQCTYLLFGVSLHLLILRTILWKERRVYRSNSFFMIYALDSIGSTIMLTLAAFIGRPIMFIPPLCPILSPFFFEPSMFLSSLYVIPNYLRAARSVNQIMMSINRMTCVIFPMDYITIWKKYLKIAIIITLLSPFLVIWNLFLSRVYISPSRGGFSPNYLKYIQWASISLLQLSFLTLAIIITIISTVITLTYLLMLPMRLKSAEKSLCFANITISIAFLIIASFQSLFAFFTLFDAGTLFILQFYGYDILNLSSPIVLILISPQLREHIFFKKEMRSGAVKVSATQHSIL